MYTPPWFSGDSPDLVGEIISRYSFAPLITPGEDLSVTHLPFLFDPERGEHGTLLAHMAKQNPHWERFAEGLQSLAIFSGPHAYVSPTWYRDEQSVPTWNYAVVHAYGQPRLLDDAAALDLLVRSLEVFEGFDRGYDYATARTYIEKRLKAIAAFEMPITRIEAKFKMSQNKSDADQERVRAELAKGGPEERAVAELMLRM